MPSEKYTIRFDDHGNILVDDPEVARRLLYVLQHDGELVIRLREGTTGSTPIVLDLRAPPPIAKNMLCPNVMCECGALKIVDEAAFDRQWSALGERRNVRGGTS